ncbi:carboxypeptidase-like regulatory domain-containing protein [Halosquirtibacter laminarini]|uniref:Carboxypeptidase-like regulatory domain-containing protein n=1 Tax=Halosquirtibacter laminarini TaxID=3374600 RepID=A0AC61NI81_9BACT|nr:carboxypeptidase-like regulatory domain-containing protein [Prolixibacteraceae bacterium]
MKHIIHYITLIITTLFSYSYVEGQERYTFEGQIIDKQNQRPIEGVWIQIEGSPQNAISDSIGHFRVQLKEGNRYTFIISHLGYKTAASTMECIGPNRRSVFRLTSKDYQIQEVTVISKESKAGGTASKIGADALQHLQPTSFADVLQLIPGGKMKYNNMSSPKWIRLREPSASASSNNKGYNNNSAFGTSFVIDGVPSINDGNIPASTSNAYASQGQDLRLVTTDGVKNITIIRGIPSVKYGEVTSGVIKIERSYQTSPFKARLKATPGSKMLSIGKGVNLFEHVNLHTDFSLLDFKQDVRTPKVNYKRYTGSVRLQYNHPFGNWEFKNRSSIDYTGSFDTVKKDPEVDIAAGSYYNRDYKKLSYAGTSRLLHTKESWFSSLELQYGITSTWQKKIMDKAVNGERMPVLVNHKEGEFYSTHLPTSYMSHYIHDNQPLSLFSNIDIHLKANTWGISHKILFGGGWVYSKNNGRGEIYDPFRPLEPSKGRPRDYRKIPASNKVSLFMEDQFTTTILGMQLDTRIGTRAMKALGVSSNYTISNKLFWDPRMNLALHLPSMRVGVNTIKTIIYGGMGWHTKLPSISQLYPELLYSDQIQLNYYSQQPSLRQIQYKTDIIDPTNTSITANRNKKIEVGIGITFLETSLQVTGYREVLSNGLRSVGNYKIISYKLYEAASGPAAETLNGPPTVDMFDYQKQDDFYVYPQLVNGSNEEKWGIEYQFDFGRIEQLNSRFSINGAWMYTKYTLTAADYRHPEQRIDNRPYPFLGYYEWDRGQKYEQLNTNIRCDTHIKKYGLIFSSILQCMWFEKNQTQPHDGKPTFYIDKQGKKYLFTNQDITDPMLRFLYSKPTPSLFDENIVPIAIDFNLTVSKRVTKEIALSFYINRILRYTPSYTNATGYKVVRKQSPYFGMELNINI